MTSAIVAPSADMRLKTRVVLLLLLSSLSLLASVVYFLIVGDDFQPSRRSQSLIIVPFSELRNSSLVARINQIIESKLKSVEIDSNLRQKAQQLIQSLVLRDHALNESAWTLAASWVTARHVIPEEAPLLGAVMRTMRESRVLKADVSRRGTQLKLALTLEGQQEVLWKPKRYSRDEIVSGLYSGFDRHNGEIVSFLLSQLLDFRRAPIVVSRVLDVQQLKAVASRALLSTFSRDCFYGQCYYCNERDSVCADSEGRLEGALILLLPKKYRLERLRNPWQRTYRTGSAAQWETDPDFCSSVQRRLPIRPRLLDLVDTCIFDFLISNADRHHYEVFKDVPNSALLLIDNGKSFGDVTLEPTILFPLFQCCFIRNSTFQRLKLLFAARLSTALTTLIKDDSLLTRPHLSALDSRLKAILALIEFCFQSKGKQKVLKK